LYCFSATFFVWQQLILFQRPSEIQRQEPLGPPVILAGSPRFLFPYLLASHHAQQFTPLNWGPHNSNHLNEVNWQIKPVFSWLVSFLLRFPLFSITVLRFRIASLPVSVPVVISAAS
jgi:hypothetical protein